MATVMTTQRIAVIGDCAAALQLSLGATMVAMKTMARNVTDGENA